MSDTERPTDPASPGRRPASALGGSPSGDHARRNGREPASRSQPLSIAVDFDGVLFDHVPYILRGFRDAHGIDLAREGLQHWDFQKYQAVRDADLTEGCVREVLDRIETDPALHEKPPKDPLASDIIAGWKKIGHQVDIVTARGEISRDVTERFLATNDVPYDDLVMEAGTKTGWDVLVDDAPHNVLAAADDGTRSLLMDQPYNRDVDAERNPARVYNWVDVARIVPTHAARAPDPR
jgi:uncharacterized HAD superfamily protein